MRRRGKNSTIGAVWVGIAVLALGGLNACAKATPPQAESTQLFRVAVFIPGYVEGSPTYEALIRGVKQAVVDAGGPQRVLTKIVEGGGNQGEWPALVAALSADGNYDLIVTANPSMPEICATVAARYPHQKFLILDGDLSGNPTIATIRFDHFAEAWLDGYFAALITTSGLKGANPDPVIGLIAAQEYPVMVQEILPGYRAGAKAANPAVRVDFRVVGGWNDASKAQAISRDMIAAGVDVVLSIAGGGNQGVLNAAKETGTYVVWYDTSGYQLMPGTVIGSSLTSVDAATRSAVGQAIRGGLVFGVAKSLGIGAGISFDTTDPLFARLVPTAIQAAQKGVLKDLVEGRRTLSRSSPIQ